jgi:hypothetical protein
MEIAASERQSDFRAKAKPADLKGFSRYYLVALPGIEDIGLYR